MQAIAEKFVNSYNSAEPKIIERAENSGLAEQKREKGEEPLDDGLLDLFPIFIEQTNGLTKELHSVKGLFEEWTSATRGFEFDAKANPRQVQLAAIKMARPLENQRKK